MASSDASSSSSSKATKIGHSLAKALKIELINTSPQPPASVLGPIIDDTYIEVDPTVKEWLTEKTPTLASTGKFFLGLFPFLTWIGRYNLTWFWGDLTAGVTVGTVVVPQGMAYAGLALLPPEFGLYSSFVGVLLYWFFATSKDITIGPVAVMSTLVGNIVSKAAITHPEIPAPVISSALALVAGCIVFILGLLRLGFIVDYIPLPAIAAFMTGSAINIAVGQIPSMMGIKGFSTRDSAYRVFINTLKYLGHTKLDAAMGLTALFFLYAVRWVFTHWAIKRWPQYSKAFFFVNTLRTAFTMLFYTMVSWLVNMNRREDPAFRILGKIPRGFKHMGVPKLNATIIGTFASDLPATVIVLLIEHIAISKSFGRLNNYTIDPSQELIAIGFSNIFGPFFGGFPATGSFSRTAIKSKAGVRTPFAGVITAAIVLLAIYALTAVFFYIPQAALSAVIIHAVGDLITPPNTVYKFWLISPIEVLIFFAGVLVTIFVTIETGIYVTVAVSGAVLLFRIAKAKGQFLGRVKVHSVIGGEGGKRTLSSESMPKPQPAIFTQFASYEPSLDGHTEVLPSGTATPIELTDAEKQTYASDLGRVVSGKIAATGSTRSSTSDLDIDNSNQRNIFLPLNYADGTNPNISIVSPYPGIFIYRFSEGLVYSNASHYTDFLVDKVTQWTRPGAVLQKLNEAKDAGDRPWNDPGPLKNKHRSTGEADVEVVDRPTLKAIILDFSSVNNVDITSVQNLIDVRNQLDRYASPMKVHWHFASVNNRWTKRALASAGFGVADDDWLNGSTGADGQPKRGKWKPVFSVAEIGSVEVVSSGAQGQSQGSRVRDVESAVGEADRLIERKRVAAVSSTNRPFFHPDLEGALRSAILNVEIDDDDE
ncbi:sulfate transporter family-domain-containing protein [Peziza echinospora]|nr:sulfate transporter family-domain-containing protein [Peziza echinospora]